MLQVRESHVQNIGNLSFGNLALQKVTQDGLLLVAEDVFSQQPLDAAREGLVVKGCRLGHEGLAGFRYSLTKVLKSLSAPIVGKKVIEKAADLGFVGNQRLKDDRLKLVHQLAQPLALALCDNLKGVVGVVGG